jgi:transcriptional regulator with XRE-family HTH domain
MFSKRLKSLREELGLNQSSLAKNLGISASTIGMYEQNRRTPDNEMLTKIAEYFNVSTDYLLGRTDIRNIENKNIKPDEEKDIEELLEKTMKELQEQQGLMLNGEIVDENDLILLRNAIRNGIEYAKNMKEAKEKKK